MEFTKQDTKVFKGIAICFMICHHLFTFPERLNGVSFISLPFPVYSGMTFASFIALFGKLCVALFTLLAGYGAYHTLSRSENKSSATARHVISLYKAFWKVFILAVPISLLLGTERGNPFLEDLIYSFLGLRFTYCNEWWFITPFAILTIFSPVFYRFVERKNSSLLTSFLWIVCVNAVIYYIIPETMRTALLEEFSQGVFWEEVYVTFTLLPAYAIGMVLAKYDVFSAVKKKCLENIRAYVLPAIIVIGGLFFIHPVNWLAYDFINAAVFIICTIVLLCTKPGRFICPLFEKLGEESTSMWLIHTLLCYHWCQRLVFAPKYAPLIFIWLVILSYIGAKLVRLFYFAIAKLTNLSHRLVTR